MIAVDTSVAVAAFATWHESHLRARAIMSREPRLPAHAALETYSVLTRLPPPHRAQQDLVRTFLDRQFPRPFLTLSSDGHRELLERAADAGIGGGAIYDALVAATALEAGAILVSRDRRAISSYELVGVEYELMP